MVKEDPSLIEYIDRSVRRVLRTKFKLGLFENPYADVRQAGRITRNKDAIALAVLRMRDLAKEQGMMNGA